MLIFPRHISTSKQIFPDMPYRPSDAEWSQDMWKIIYNSFCWLDFTKSWFDVSFSSKGPSGRRVKPSPPAPPYYSLSISIRSKYALRVTGVDRKMIPDVSRSFWYLQFSFSWNFKSHQFFHYFSHPCTIFLIFPRFISSSKQIFTDMPYGPSDAK